MSCPTCPGTQVWTAKVWNLPLNSASSSRFKASFTAKHPETARTTRDYPESPGMETRSYRDHAGFRKLLRPSVLRRWGVSTSCTAETLRKWVRQAERDSGERGGLTTQERTRLKELERENRELRRANEILRKASAYFAQAELDRRPRK
jgi:transposase